MIQHRIQGETFAGLAAEVLDDLEPRAVAAVNNALDIGHASVTDLLSRPVGADGKGSKAGTPPFLRRGVLRRSVKIQKAQAKSNVIAGAIYSNHPAAGAHEFGGSVGRKKKIKLPARSYMRAGLERKEAEILEALEDL